MNGRPSAGQRLLGRKASPALAATMDQESHRLRPWIRAEDLVDRATSAFVEAAVISWTGVHIGLGGSGPVFVR